MSGPYNMFVFRLLKVNEKFKNFCFYFLVLYLRFLRGIPVDTP